MADIAGVIRELGYERAVLCGHDWGGIIAWSFAERHPEMLDGLILVNTLNPALYKKNITPAQALQSYY
ncbi:hypothetical protein HK102_012029, partial [Quaeritorhiza haematococci]